jgi:hypothetical protein
MLLMGSVMLVELPCPVRAVELMPFAGTKTECNKYGK